MMRYLVLCLTMLSAGVPAWPASNTDAAAPSAPSVPASYRLVPGDVIEITVSSHEGYNRTATIQPDGRIDFPGAGEMMAAGLTPVQLAACLQKGLNAELVDPRVTVSLKELNRGLMRRVSVLGAVRNPNVYELKEQSTVAELLATAGGPTPVADLRRVTVTRPDGGKKAIVDLSGTARTGDLERNPALEPGDLIIVPEGPPPTVQVLGEVAKPGSYEILGEMRLLHALSLAGGPTPKADLHRVTLTRAGQPDKEVLDLQDLMTKGQQQDLSVDVVLHPGDTLVLPENERKYYVLGEVNRSEAYPLKPTDRLLDAITTAGGSTRDADLAKVMLIRKDARGQLAARRIDLKKMMKAGDMALNEALQAGDVVFVPSHKQGRPITDYLNFLYPLSGLLNVVH